MDALERIQMGGFSGRFGHRCLYDVIYEAVILSKPLSYLEIGVFDGASLAVVLSEAKLERLVLCDIFNRDYQTWNGGTSQPVGSHAHIDKLLERMKFNGEVSIYVEDSRSAIPKVRGSFDLIHIDGNHDTEYARADFNNCLPLLKTGGYLVMDDTSFTSVKPVCAEILAAGLKHVLTLTDKDSASSLYRLTAPNLVEG